MLFFLLMLTRLSYIAHFEIFWRSDLLEPTTNFSLRFNTQTSQSLLHLPPSLVILCPSLLLSTSALLLHPHSAYTHLFTPRHVPDQESTTLHPLPPPPYPHNFDYRQHLSRHRLIYDMINTGRKCQQLYMNVVVHVLVDHVLVDHVASCSRG